MKTVEITTSAASQKYSITIGSNIIDHITDYVDFEGYSSIMIISDSHVSTIYLAKLVDALRKQVLKEHIHSHIFEPGEKNKTLATVQKMYNAFLDSGLDRKSLIINLGGGITSDMGGFAASTYLRGISYMNIPTTLEAMVDASVGGKTGVNFDSYKNYIGVFSQPVEILIDIDVLKTLDNRALIQGYSEVIKHGLIADAKYFLKLKNKKTHDADTQELIEIIKESISIKAEIVRQDVKEKGVRKLLNFGHTVGHAIETLSFSSSNPLYHGEAVAIGMIAESYISNVIGMLSDEEFKTIEKVITGFGLPTRYHTSHTTDEILRIITKDKKSESGMMKWSLLEKIGQAEFNVVVDQKFVLQALEYILHE